MDENERDERRFHQRSNGESWVEPGDEAWVGSGHGVEQATMFGTLTALLGGGAWLTLVTVAAVGRAAVAPVLAANSAMRRAVVPPPG
jgi:hypothetical protein